MPERRPILCLGAAHWDLIGRAAAPFSPGGDLPGRIERRAGGVAANVALALAALGRPVVLLAAIGRDPAGNRLVAALTRRGVDCGHVLRHAGATDRYLAIEDGAGELVAAVADCAGLERAGEEIVRPLRDGALAAPERPWRGRVVVDGNLPAPVLAALVARRRRGRAGPGRGEPRQSRPADAAGQPADRDPLSQPARGRGALRRCLRRQPRRRRGAAAARGGLGGRHRRRGDGHHRRAAGPTLSLAPPPVAAGGATGAGDALLAAHLAALDDGLDREAALRTALAAAGPARGRRTAARLLPPAAHGNFHLAGPLLTD